MFHIHCITLFVSLHPLRKHSNQMGGLLRNVVIMSCSSETEWRRNKYQKYFRPCCIQRGAGVYRCAQTASVYGKNEHVQRAVGQESWSGEIKCIWTVVPPIGSEMKDLLCDDNSSLSTMQRKLSNLIMPVTITHHWHWKALHACACEAFVMTDSWVKRTHLLGWQFLLLLSMCMLCS